MLPSLQNRKTMHIKIFAVHISTVDDTLIQFKHCVYAYTQRCPTAPALFLTGTNACTYFKAQSKCEILI